MASASSGWRVRSAAGEPRLQPRSSSLCTLGREVLRGPRIRCPDLPVGGSTSARPPAVHEGGHRVPRTVSGSTSDFGRSTTGTGRDSGVWGLGAGGQEALRTEVEGGHRTPIPLRFTEEGLVVLFPCFPPVRLTHSSTTVTPSSTASGSPGVESHSVHHVTWCPSLDPGPPVPFGLVSRSWRKLTLSVASPECGLPDVCTI